MNKKAIVIGDGPAGLGAALYLAKNGIATTVFGLDKTSMHAAYLYNYLGIPAMSGTEFQEISRKQVIDLGAQIIAEQVTGIERTEAGFSVRTGENGVYSADYVLIAEGKGRKLAKSLGLEETADGIAVDQDFGAAINGLYVVGRTTRTGRSQAIISAGHGASAAIDIISRERGADFRDFDEAPGDA